MIAVRPSAFRTLDEAARWYRAWLLDLALPYWASTGFDLETGGFHEQVTSVGADWTVGRRARVQARQIWTYATAARRNRDGEALHLAQSAFEAYIRHYRGSDDLMVSVVLRDGVKVEGLASLYDQAFALLAMASLHAIEPDETILGHGERLRDAIQAFRHPAGGFRESGRHPFQANAHMHLLEAALAWEEAGQASWARLADEIVELALARFIDPEGGFLREFFDADWGPSPGDDGRRFEPGHQFEWAWLLDRWGAARGNCRAREVAQRLYACGRAGVEGARKVAVNALWDDLTIADADARLWPQTEYLKAALRLGRPTDALLAANGLSAYLGKPAPAAWRDVQRPDGSFVDQPAPASSFYHLAGAIFELTSMG